MTVQVQQIKIYSRDKDYKPSLSCFSEYHSYVLFEFSKCGVQILSIIIYTVLDYAVLL